MRLWAGLIAHPLQRPLALSRGLSAQAFWEPSTFPWLAGLLRPDSIAKMQRGEHGRLQTTFLARLLRSLHTVGAVRQSWARRMLRWMRRHRSRGFIWAAGGARCI